MLTLPGVPGGLTTAGAGSSPLVVGAMSTLEVGPCARTGHDAPSAARISTARLIKPGFRYKQRGGGGDRSFCMKMVAA